SRLGFFIFFFSGHYKLRLRVIINGCVLHAFAGCFYSTMLGGLRSYENPKNKITAIPAKEEEIWGATFKVIDLFFKNKPYLIFFFHKGSYTNNGCGNTGGRSNSSCRLI